MNLSIIKRAGNITLNCMLNFRPFFPQIYSTLCTVSFFACDLPLKNTCYLQSGVKRVDELMSDEIDDYLACFTILSTCSRVKASVVI